jgi:hypothetical protein
MRARAKVVAFAIAASSLGAPAMARADDAPQERARYAIETDVTGAYTKVLTAFDKQHDLSRSDTGAGLALTVLFRSPYFLSPFLDISYVPMQSSQQWVDLGPYGGPAVATASLRGYGIIVGPAYDFWRMRVRAGIGAYDVIVHASVLHEEIRPSELDLGYMLAVSGWALRLRTGRREFKVGLEARLGLVTEAALNYVSIGATLTEDAITW